MIVVRLKGGLGNQMFQYALGRVLSLKNNTDLVFNTEAYEDKSTRLFKSNFTMRELQLDVFTVAGRVAKKSEIPFLYRMYGKGKMMMFIDAMRRRFFPNRAKEIYFEQYNQDLLNLGSNIYLDGYFQSPKYFIGYEDIIKKDFTLKNTPAPAIEKLAREIQSGGSLCIHVRRGDYVGNAYHEIVGKEYYKTAISIVSKQRTINTVYVFSDDIDWCKENMSFDFPVVFVGSEYVGVKDEGHMYLMSCCNYFIIPNSSFSWWAVWLSLSNDKLVVCPKQWFGDASITTNDLIPEEWIRI